MREDREKAQELCGINRLIEALFRNFRDQDAKGCERNVAE